MLEFDLHIVGQRLRTAKKVLAITGAGIGAESGVPTFRGAGGYWRNFRAEDLASPEGFARDPRMVWEWYSERQRGMLNARPNPGHEALAVLDERIDDFLLATQNIGGLHQIAGARRFEAIHGDIWTTRCLRCCDERREPGRVYEQLLPKCGRCGGTLRPAVVWFGEMLPVEPLERILAFLSTSPPVELALVIGTTAVFGYIQSWAFTVQREKGLLVEINPEGTVLSAHADVCLRGPSGEILPELLREAGVD